jgi:hypothetical protein
VLADQRIERLVLNLDAVGLREPRLQGFIGGEACRRVEGRLETGEDIGAEGGAFASRDVDLEEGGQTTRRIGSQPACHGVATDAQELGNLHAGVGLATAQEIEHLETGATAAIMVTLQPVFELIRGFSNGRQRAVHSDTSRYPMIERTSIAYPCPIFNSNSYNPPRLPYWHRAM